jgi:glucose-1-phosphate thymidylyltransferase
MYMNDGNKTKINLRNKSVFITGVAGFIGSNLAKRLLSTVEGVKVVGLDNMNHYYDVRLKEARLNELEQFDNFSFVKGNLADKAVIESIFEQYKPEIVVNLGAQAGVRYSITNPDAYVEANLIGFYNILEACRHSYDEGHTPVEHLVDTTDIDEFVVISNHKFAQHFENWKNNKQKTRPYEITVIDDGTSTNETRLGAVKDIQLAVEKLNLADDLLVMAGDNVLDFSLSKFVDFAKEKNTSCVMCHEENELKKQQKTAIITLDNSDLITSYEEKPKEPKGNLAVPPFYCYRACDVKRIQEALNNGCGYDAPGSFAAWLSKQTPMHAYIMPGKRYDIGDINSYEYVKSVFSK